MRYRHLPPREAIGSLFAHRLKGFDKGAPVSETAAAQLEASGVHEVAVVQLDSGDLGEDLAAQVLLDWARGPNCLPGQVTRGRGNLYARATGLFLADRQAIEQFNARDPAITLATLEPYSPVEAGQLLATFKIIPFAAPKAALDDLLQRPLGLDVALFRPRRVGVVQTDSGLLKRSVLTKSFEVMRARLAARGVGPDHLTEQTVAHDPAALAALLRDRVARDQLDLLIILGETAIADVQDVIPAALTAAGGEVIHFGMPVDPGNLLLLGRLGRLPVVGAPGCARAPTLNGFDFVLDRLLADLPLDAEDITAMGVGGLLKQDSDGRLIARQRDQPTERVQASSPPVAALLLAAGFGRRMGGADKLALAANDGGTVLLASAQPFGGCAPRLLVSRPEQPRQLEGWQSVEVTGPQPQLSDSLRAGLLALPADCPAVLVGLGDMPALQAETVAALVAAFQPERGIWAVRPRYAGKIGNPVLVGRRFFEKLLALRGDRGARALLDAQSHLVLDIEVDDPGILIDVDDPDAYRRYRERA